MVNADTRITKHHIWNMVAVMVLFCCASATCMWVEIPMIDRALADYRVSSSK